MVGAVSDGVKRGGGGRRPSSGGAATRCVHRGSPSTFIIEHNAFSRKEHPVNSRDG